MDIWTSLPSPREKYNCTIWKISIPSGMKYTIEFCKFELFHDDDDDDDDIDDGFYTQNNLATIVVDGTHIFLCQTDVRTSGATTAIM